MLARDVLSQYFSSTNIKGLKNTNLSHLSSTEADHRYLKQGLTSVIRRRKSSNLEFLAYLLDVVRNSWQDYDGGYQLLMERHSNPSSYPCYMSVHGLQAANNCFSNCGTWDSMRSSSSLPSVFSGILPVWLLARANGRLQSRKAGAHARTDPCVHKKPPLWQMLAIFQA